MNLLEKIGQMIVVRASGHLLDNQRLYPSWEADNQTLKSYLEELKIGGVILLGGSVGELRLKTQFLQENASSPLLICADIEEGVGQRFAGATFFPPLMALGEVYQSNPILARELAYQMGQYTAKEALSLGINWILAPVLDVNNNPDNPVINVRSISHDPHIVADLGCHFIQGARTYPILTTAKHFPGHGDTNIDSHLSLPTIPHDASRLERVELYPFREAIGYRVDAIMSAHLLIPAWDQCYPATLSRAILTGQLRETMGFTGLIVTDALIMGGVKNYASPEEIAILAVLAGADILLMPENPEIVVKTLYDAVKSGKISEDRLSASVERIRQAKAKVQHSLSPLEEVGEMRSNELSRSILFHSLRKTANLPLIPGNNGKNLIIVESLLHNDFITRRSPAVTIPQEYGYETVKIDASLLSHFTLEGKNHLLQLFIRANPFRGSAGLSSKLKSFILALLHRQAITGMVIYGSPYVWEELQHDCSEEVKAVFTYGQTEMAQSIALSQLFEDLSQFDDIITADFV